MPQFIATAAIVAVSSTAFAGGLSSEIMAPAASSINPSYIVPGVLAALLIAAAIADDEAPVAQTLVRLIGASLMPPF